MLPSYVQTVLISALLLLSFASARHLKRGVKASRSSDVPKELQQKHQDFQHLLNSGLSRLDAERIINSYNYQYNTHHDYNENVIPNDVIKPVESFIFTRGPDTSVSSTSEYYPSTPPWYRLHVLYNNNKDVLLHNKKGDSHVESGSFATHMPISTTTDLSQCPCDNKNNMDTLLNILSSAAPAEEKRNNLLQIGLYSEEHARRCYQFCINHSPSMSFSFSTGNVQTFPPESQNYIEIATESVDPDAFNFDRYHCYEIMLAKTETRSCVYSHYSPTRDSPKPSTNPPGQNIWTCCKKIPTYRAYYNY